MKFFLLGVISFIISLNGSEVCAKNTSYSIQKKKYKKKHRKIILKHDERASSALTSTLSKPSLGDTISSRITVRPILSYSFINPTALNGILANFANMNGLNESYAVSGAPTFSIAGDYEINPHFLVGFRMDWFTASTNRIAFSDRDMTANFQTFVSGLPFYSTATFKQPVFKHISLGVTTGLGVPIFYRGEFVVTGSNLSAYPNGAMTYSAKPFTGFGLGFLDWVIGKDFILRSELGYRLLSSDQVTLAHQYNTIRQGTTLADQHHRKVPLDSSAFFLGASALIHL